MIVIGLFLVKCQEAIVGFHDGRFIQVVMEMAMNHGSEDVRYNCLGIIGHLALNGKSKTPL